MDVNIEKEVQEIIGKINTLLDRTLPIGAGKIAVSHFKENFQQGGFVNGGLQAWTPAKRLSSGGGSASSKYGTLMSERKHLYSSMTYTPGNRSVIISNDVPYAAIHNFGGSTHPKVTPKMRRWAWAQYFDKAGIKKGMPREQRQAVEASAGEDATMWRRLALTRKTQLDVKIPQRQFMGNSAELNDKITRYIEAQLDKIL